MNVSSRFWKEFSLCSVFLFFHVLAFWTFSGLMPMITEGNFGQYRRFFLPVISLTLAAACFSLFALLVKDNRLRAPTLIAAGLAPFIFALPTTGIALGVLALTLLLVWQAASAIQKEADSSLRCRIARFLKQGLGFYFTAAALALSLFYLNRIDDREVFSALFPQPLFDFVLHSFSGTIQGATGLPRIRPDQTVNQVITEAINAQFRSQGVSPEKISKNELKRLVDAQREALAQGYHLAINGGEKVGVVFSDAVRSKVKEWVGAYNTYLPLAAAIAFFFLLKMVFVALYFVAILLALLLMRLLVLVKVVKKENRQVDAERFAL